MHIYFILFGAIARSLWHLALTAHPRLHQSVAQQRCDRFILSFVLLVITERGENHSRLSMLRGRAWVFSVALVPLFSLVKPQLAIRVGLFLVVAGVVLVNVYKVDINA